MGPPTKTAALVLESAVIKQAGGINVEIPSAKENPFITIPKTKQGTLYVIIFPIIAGIIILYLIGALIKKLKASRQAKKVEPFDRDYEFYDYNSEITRDQDDTTLNPFGDDYFVGNSSFVNHHHKKSSVDLISQYRRSIEFLSGSRDQDSNNLHRKTESRGSVLQLNFNEQPQLKPRHETMSDAASNDLPVFYSVVNTPVVGSQINDSSSSKASESSTMFYSIAEPQKTASVILANNHNKIQQHHTRTSSSLALDEFINTGVLPVLNQTPNNIPANVNNSPLMESHSMFENNDNNSYNIPVSSSTILQAQAVPRSPSPQRQRVYMQSVTSRSPSRSPVRSQRSSIREDVSPSRSSRSPTRASDSSPSRSSLRSQIPDPAKSFIGNPFTRV